MRAQRNETIFLVALLIRCAITSSGGDDTEPETLEVADSTVNLAFWLCLDLDCNPENNQSVKRQEKGLKLLLPSLLLKHRRIF